MHARVAGRRSKPVTEHTIDLFSTTYSGVPSVTVLSIAATQSGCSKLTSVCTRPDRAGLIVEHTSGGWHVRMVPLCLTLLPPMATDTDAMLNLGVSQVDGLSLQKDDKAFLDR